MNAIRVVILYKDRVESISVDGEEMLDLSAIVNKPIEAWFEPSGGRDGWEGFLKEIRKQTGDEDAELAFEFHGSQESKIIFENCLRKHGLGANALSREEILRENMEEARKAEHRGLHSKAFKYYYSSAAAYQIPEAQCKAAEYYERMFDGEDIGIDVRPQDAIAYAVDFYEKAARQDCRPAQRRLYQLFAKGKGVRQSWEEAVSWLQAAAESGAPEDLRLLAWHCQTGTGVAEDKERAFSMYAALAEEGDAGAQYELGRCFDRGLGTARDGDAALAWYQKAAGQGHAEAQLEVAICYDGGYSVQEDKEKALFWFQKAAAQGSPVAQYTLGSRCEAGEDVEQDLKTAFRWYAKAAEQDFPSAECAVGRCLQFSIGTEADREKAVEWYRRAVSHGSQQARYYLGMCYESGTGVEKDPEKARELYETAWEHGDRNAAERLMYFVIDGLCAEFCKIPGAASREDRKNRFVSASKDIRCQRVFLWHDGGMAGAHRTGFAFTDTGIWYRNGFESLRRISYEELAYLEISVRGRGKYLLGEHQITYCPGKKYRRSEDEFPRLLFRVREAGGKYLL